MSEHVDEKFLFNDIKLSGSLIDGFRLVCIVLDGNKHHR